MSTEQKGQNEVLAYLRIELSLLDDKIIYSRREHHDKKDFPQLLENLESQKIVVERILKVSESLFDTQNR
jgi:hypothetical protein